MTKFTYQINNMEPTHSKYFTLMEKNKAVIWQMLESCDESMFHWKADEGTWSLAQVLDHLIFSEASAISYCRKKMQAGDDMPNATMFNTLKIKLYYWALDTKLRFKAPKPISRPNNDKTINQTLDYWEQTRTDYRSFLDSYPVKFQNKAVFRHPLAGRIKLSEMLRFLNHHLIHHQYQIDRIIRSFQQSA